MTVSILDKIHFCAEIQHKPVYHINFVWAYTGE